jgi:hypothetical protein
VDDLSLAIGAKSSRVINDEHLKCLRQLADDQTVKRREILCLEPKPRITNDGIIIVPASELADFSTRLLTTNDGGQDCATKPTFFTGPVKKVPLMAQIGITRTFE